MAAAATAATVVAAAAAAAAGWAGSAAEAGCEGGRHIISCVPQPHTTNHTTRSVSLSLSLSLSISLSLSLSLCLSVSRSVANSLALALALSQTLSLRVSLSRSLSVSLLLCRKLSRSVCLSLCPSLNQVPRRWRTGWRRRRGAGRRWWRRRRRRSPHVVFHRAVLPHRQRRQNLKPSNGVQRGATGPQLPLPRLAPVRAHAHGAGVSRGPPLHQMVACARVARAVLSVRSERGDETVGEASVDGPLFTLPAPGGGPERYPSR